MHIKVPTQFEVKFPSDIQFSDDEFFRFCQENRDLRFERAHNGSIIIKTPYGGKTGSRNAKISYMLAMWNRRTNYGFAFGSSIGFILPDNAVFCPSASIITHQQKNQLSDKEWESLSYLCPKFIIELKSKNDHIPTLQTKMQNWLANGIRLGWLIDPDKENVYIYRPQQTVETIEGFDNTLSGEEVLKGFELDLSILR